MTSIAACCAGCARRCCARTCTLPSATRWRSCVGLLECKTQLWCILRSGASKRKMSSSSRHHVGNDHHRQSMVRAEGHLDRKVAHIAGPANCVPSLEAHTLVGGLTPCPHVGPQAFTIRSCHTWLSCLLSLSFMGRLSVNFISMQQKLQQFGLGHEIRRA